MPWWGWLALGSWLAAAAGLSLMVARAIHIADHGQPPRGDDAPPTSPPPR